ncbi:hypothetical protein [Streptococcus vestibularis]|uniref:hypothetical protein n=1 Tax=Streptococcus vestibularis TaxID=1343 RepID=UPI0026EC63BA|nr:hypothetical protein [Streptococcus vestibularis]
MYIQDDLKECLKLQFRDITYKVNEEKGVVVALAHFRTPLCMEAGANQCINTIGIARLNKSAGDTFNVEVGKKIARAKAEKEAFIQFKTMLLNYENRVFQARLDISKAIDTMSSHIEHQKEYIKSF